MAIDGHHFGRRPSSPPRPIKAHPRALWLLLRTPLAPPTPPPRPHTRRRTGNPPPPVAPLPPCHWWPVRNLVAATGPGRAPEPCLLPGAPPEFLIVRHPLPLLDRSADRAPPSSSTSGRRRRSPPPPHSQRPSRLQLVAVVVSKISPASIYLTPRSSLASARRRQPRRPLAVRAAVSTEVAFWSPWSGSPSSPLRVELILIAKGCPTAARRMRASLAARSPANASD
jgi:hypothetical protein